MSSNSVLPKDILSQLDSLSLSDNTLDNNTLDNNIGIGTGRIKLSIGVKRFGVDNVLEQLIYFVNKFNEKYPDIKFISIGSGMGYLEDLVYKETGIKIYKIDIDPELQDYTDYSSMEECLETLDNVINNCMLIIIWPFPSPLPTIGYDYNAIELFKPMSIFTLVESLFNQNGAAGSEIFHNKYLINNHLQYNKEHITIATHTEHKNVIYKMILLLNKDYPSIKPINLPTKVEGNPKFHASECIIC